MKHIYIECTICQLQITISKLTKIELLVPKSPTTLKIVRETEIIREEIGTVIFTFSCLTGLAESRCFLSPWPYSHCLDPGHLRQLGHVLYPQLSERTWPDIQLHRIIHTG